MTRARDRIGRIAAPQPAIDAPVDVAGDPDRHLGAGLRLAADGHLLGDDPRAAAGLPGDRARRLGADRRRDRGHRRSDRLDHQGVLRRAVSDWLGKRKLLAALGYGLAAFTKPIFPLAHLDRLAGRGAFHRPRRQGHPRRAARRAGRRHRAARICAARASACASRSTPSAPFSGRCSRSRLMWLTADNFRAVFWIAVIPAFLSRRA